MRELRSDDVPNWHCCFNNSHLFFSSLRKFEFGVCFSDQRSILRAVKKKEIWKPKKCGRYLFNFNVNLSEIWWRYDEQSNVYSSGHEHPMTNVSSQEIPMIYHEFVMLCPLFIPCLFPFISWRENLERKLVWNADAKWLVWVAAANYWNKISYKSIFAFQIISLSLFQRHKSHSWNWNIQSGE